MKWFVAIVLALHLVVPAASLACPNCKEAITAAGDEADNDPLREARAYNNSIYVMLAVPYALLGSMGFAGYRMYRSGQRCGPPAT